MSLATPTADPAFEWQPQPAAASLVNRLLSEYTAQHARLHMFANELQLQTGTRLIDWVDHLVVPKGDPRQLLAQLRGEHRSHKVLLVGHTDTLPGLLSALGYPGNVKIEAEDYGNIFVLVPQGEGPPVVTHLHY